MEIELLREFIVLAETGSYWQAAERLYMNQSTLSKHIRALEKELDVPLFDRTTRSVKLTEYGQTLLPHARTIAASQYEYAAALRLQKEYKSNIARFDGITALAQYGLGELMIAYPRENPGFYEHLEENGSYAAIRNLAQRRCDFAFSWAFPGMDSVAGKRALSSIPIATDHIAALVSKGHALAGREGITIRELKDERFSFPPIGTVPYDLCRKACQEAGFTPLVVCSSPMTENVLGTLLDNVHTALMMTRCVAAVNDFFPAMEERLTVLPLAPVISCTLSLYWLRDVPLSPAAQRFLEFFGQWRKTHP